MLLYFVWPLVLACDSGQADRQADQNLSFDNFWLLEVAFGCRFGGRKPY